MDTCQILNVVATALSYTGLTLATITVIHAFIALIIWSNNLLFQKIAKQRNLSHIFRVLFLHNQETIRKHENEIHEYIEVLASRDLAEKKRTK